MVVVAGQLVGRGKELDLIDGALAEVDRGRALALAVLGEPGIGKTRLLAELAGRADRSGLLVLAGSASELEHDLPFGVLVDALDEYVEGLESRLVAALDVDVRTELGQVFPSLAALAVGSVAAFPQERYRTHRAVRELLQRLAGTRPVVLILDDFHWADPASVELLAALLRRPPNAAVLIAVGMRPRQAPQGLVAAFGRAEREGTLTGVELGGLTRREAHELLGDAVVGAAADVLYDESGGNPFYLQQLVRSAVEVTAAHHRIDRDALEVPPTVAVALAEEIAVLSSDVRRVLHGAAVAGDPFEPELAAAAASFTETSTLEAVDELLRLGLVTETEVPRRFRFRHPIVRRAVYESTPAGWRLGAHQRAAELLSVRGAPAVEQALHLQRCARQGDLAAVATLREAGEGAAQRAPASAATWFAEALRLLPAAAPVDVRLSLVLARARLLVAAGQFIAAHAALRDSLTLVPPEAIPMRVRLITACAAVEHLLGHHDQAHARLTNAVDGLTERHSPEAATLMIELAMDSFSVMDYERMREWAEEAFTTVRPLGDRTLTAAAVAVLTFAAAASGATTAAQSRQSEAVTLVDGLDDAELDLRLDAAANLAGAELYLNLYADAERHAERALSIARATGQSEFIPLAHSILGQVKLLRGELAAASEFLDDAIDGARLSGNVQALAGNLVNRTFAAVAAGDVDLARTTAEENAELSSGLNQSMVCAAGAALAATLVEQGDPQRAVTVLVASSGGENLPLFPGVWRPRYLELLTRCWIALGHYDDAERSAATARTCAAALNLPMADAMADRAAAAVALQYGDPDVAARHALASADAAADAGAPVEAAISRALAGQALTRAGRTDEAVSALRRAAAELDSCGAIRHRAAAEHALRRLGQHVHRRTRRGTADGSGVDTLTERELQVARLIIDRRTNTEIAAELFLGRKTIETHIRNIFHKLHVTSRVEVARTVERFLPRPDQ